MLTKCRVYVRQKDKEKQNSSDKYHKYKVTIKEVSKID
jgi:hypothetical protein